jgi:hypothetical protein
MMRKGLACVVVVAAVSLLASCIPIRNAPSGGGQTVTATFRYGPFTLGPGEEVQGSPSSGMPRPAGAFGLTGARFDVVDATTGTPVSVHDVHLHHIVMTSSVRNDVLCPGRRERPIGSGMERTPISLPSPYVYLVAANDNWGSIYHLMNETAPGTPDKTVYIQYQIDYQPGANATNSRPVVPHFMDVTGCGNSTYDIPGNGGPGSVHTNSRSWTAPNDGIVVGAGGHLHEGGIDITLRDPTRNMNCTMVAEYHENPRHLSKIPPCNIHYPVVAGRPYTVISRYDNSQPWIDVMGIVLAYVWFGTQ